MRISKRAIYQCDECGATECAREVKLRGAPYMVGREFQLCDRCSEKLASMLLQRVREARLASTRPPQDQGTTTGGTDATC